MSGGWPAPSKSIAPPMRRASPCERMKPSTESLPRSRIQGRMVFLKSLADPQSSSQRRCPVSTATAPPSAKSKIVIAAGARSRVPKRRLDPGKAAAACTIRMRALMRAKLALLKTAATAPLSNPPNSARTAVAIMPKASGIMTRFANKEESETI